MKQKSKMIQIDLNSGLKEEPVINLQLYTICKGNGRILNMSESQFRRIWLDICNFLNVPEYAWNITCLNNTMPPNLLGLRLEHAWIALEYCLKLAKYVNGSAVIIITI